MISTEFSAEEPFRRAVDRRFAIIYRSLGSLEQGDRRKRHGTRGLWEGTSSQPDSAE
jgi:hypothetical protein